MKNIKKIKKRVKLFVIEVVLDTETTGLSVKDGHRIVEIGCIELDNLVPTKKFFIAILTRREKFQKMH